MKDYVRSQLINRLPRLWLLRSLLVGKDSYLRTTGWLESCRGGVPCRPDGKEIPWMNFSIIAFLEERLTKELSLFEFGSGYSTKFFAELVGSVTSVEYDQKWFEEISTRVKGNAEILFVAKDIDGQYCRSVRSSGHRYDVIVVDGRDRINCMIHSIETLTPRGVLILDDSHRGRYQTAFEIGRSNGFKALNFQGLKPTGISSDQSTLFYREGNCLNL